jgi:hypothetical protein
LRNNEKYEGTLDHEGKNQAEKPRRPSRLGHTCVPLITQYGYSRKQHDCATWLTGCGDLSWCCVWVGSTLPAPKPPHAPKSKWGIDGYRIDCYELFVSGNHLDHKFLIGSTNKLKSLNSWQGMVLFILNFLLFQQKAKWSLDNVEAPWGQELVKRKSSDLRQPWF